MFNIHKNKLINLDYASITPVDDGVIKVMNKISKEFPANPSSLHKAGLESKNILEKSREEIAVLLKARKNEIIFTSGGTESNNIAVRGVVDLALNKNPNKKIRIITTKIEHSSVLEIFKYYETLGVEVVYLNVDNNGLLNIKELKEALNTDVVLVSVIFVNNEIGSVQSIRDIAKEIRGFNKNNNTSIKFHTDASQAVITEEIDLNTLGADLLTLDGSKFYGPRSSGLLFIKTGTELKPVILGGGQESGLRSGTENVASIAGFSYALNKIISNRDKNLKKINKISLYLDREIEKLSKKLNKKIKINTKINKTHIKSICFEGLDAEYLMFYLDARGVFVSTKSSCLRDEEESYVLKALGLNREEMLGTIRLSIGLDTDKSHIDKFIKIVKECYNVAHGSLK